MGNFEEARKFNGNIISHLSSFLSNSSTPVLLLEKEPNNLQAHSLAQLIEKGVSRGTVSFYLLCRMLKLILTDGYIGMAIVGGAAALGTLALAGLIRRATRK